MQVMLVVVRRRRRHGRVGRGRVIGVVVIPDKGQAPPGGQDGRGSGPRPAAPSTHGRRPGRSGSSRCCCWRRTAARRGRWSTTGWEGFGAIPSPAAVVPTVLLLLWVVMRVRRGVVGVVHPTQITQVFGGHGGAQTVPNATGLDSCFRTSIHTQGGYV